MDNKSCHRKKYSKHVSLLQIWSDRGTLTTSKSSKTGATTLSITTFSIITLSITINKNTTYSIMTLRNTCRALLCWMSHVCWVTHVSPLCWVCWVSLCWVSFMQSFFCINSSRNRTFDLRNLRIKDKCSTTVLLGQKIKV